MTESKFTTEPLPDRECDLRCRKCLAIVAAKVRPLDPATELFIDRALPLRSLDGQATFPAGYAIRPIDLGDSPNRRGLFELRDGYLLNKEALVNVSRTHEHFGCCGTVHDEGPNLLCEHGHPIGAEMSDCVHPHFVWLYGNRVLPTLEEWGIAGESS